MIRIRTVVSLLVAIVMTAFTFGVIGQSAEVHGYSHEMPGLTHIVSAGLAGTRVALVDVLTHLVQKG